MSKETPSAEAVGYGFAYFRSHSLFTGRCDPWLIPGFVPTGMNQTNLGDCACGDGYRVSDQYHWHDLGGKCHNRVECK